MRRLVRAAVSFVIVLLAYGVYGWVAVPLIEPAAERPELPVGGASGTRDSRPELEMLSVLFPAGSWELDNPKMLENDQFKLLIRDYRNMGDGRVELRPCTMVLLPEAEPDEDARDRMSRAVVLQAPHGALLSFDRPLNISRGDIGRLIAAQLIGPITIRGRGRLPGPEDDLELTTRDVQMNEQQVWTPHPVEFRWGPNHGRGQQMRITLRRGERTGARGPNIAGIELFELAHIEHLHLELGDSRGRGAGANGAATAAAAAGAASAPAPQAAAAATATASSASAPRGPGKSGGLLRGDGNRRVPIEVACRGPFRCDFVQQNITLEDQVVVWRVNPAGPTDQLRADSLLIALCQREPRAASPAEAAQPDEKAKPQMFDFDIEYIEARGRPVVLSAPSDKLEARGERMRYELPVERIILDGTGESWIQQGGNEVCGRSLQYQSAPGGRIAMARVDGPGWIRARSDDRPQEFFEARWGEQLHLRPSDGNQVLSLLGGAELTYGGFGTLAAKEIHGWFVERVSPARRRTTLDPDRMLARGSVQLQANQLSGSVEQLEVWFEPAAVVQAPQSAATPAPPRGDATSPDGWESADDSKGQAAAAPGPAPLQHIQFTADLLRARVLWSPQGQSEPNELLFEGKVRISEAAGAPEVRPLLVLGDRLHVIEALRPEAAVVVSGRPARVEVRGLGLTGSNINLNRGTNRLWVEGSGWMDVPVDRDMDGRPLPEPQHVRIDWKRQMTFDGRTARFEENVIAASQTMNLRTESLDVQFDPPIRFAEFTGRTNPTVEQLLCRCGVLMENRSYNNGVQTSFDRLHVVDLALNLKTGALSAGGPGWLSSVRRAEGESARAVPGLPFARNAATGANAARSPLGPAAGARDPAGAAETALWGLQVRFQGTTSGNVRQRSLQFNQQVAAAFAPVHSWTATLPVDQPELLGPDGFVMHCDQLRIDQVASLLRDRPSLELTASGNTVVEGNNFTARAARMTYAEAKDLLVFEGDGRNDANLYQQKQAGGERSHVAARKIRYWNKAKKLEIDGARSLELSGLPAPGEP